MHLVYRSDPADFRRRPCFDALSHSNRRSIRACLSNSFSHPRAVSQCPSFAGSASMGSRTRLPCPPRVAISSVLNAQHISLRPPFLPGEPATVFAKRDNQGVLRRGHRQRQSLRLLLLRRLLHSLLRLRPCLKSMDHLRFPAPYSWCRTARRMSQTRKGSQTPMTWTCQTDSVSSRLLYVSKARNIIPLTL